MKVGQILQSKGAEVFAVQDTDRVADAVALLTDKNIGAVVVRDAKGVLIGILSERDIVRQLKIDGAAALDARVSACMTRRPFTCTTEHSVDELMAMMTERRIRHIPVVEDGLLIGLVSIGDVVKRKIEETEREAAALKQYIAS